MDVVVELAKRGATQLLKDKKDPDDVWTRAVNGDFGRKPPKNIPLIVKAIAKSGGISDLDAFKAWKLADKAQKKSYRTNPFLRKIMAEIEIEQLGHSP